MNAAKPKSLPDGRRPKWASFRYCSAECGIGEITLRKCAKEGRLRTTTVGGRRLVSLESLDELLEENATGGRRSA